jgi:hypothetical protein
MDPRPTMVPHIQLSIGQWIRPTYGPKQSRPQAGIYGGLDSQVLRPKLRWTQVILFHEN